MVKVVFLPSDPSRTCLDVPTLLSAFSTIAGSSSIEVQTEVDADTEGVFWLPNIAQGNTSDELSSIVLSDVAGKVRFVQLPMTGVDHFIELIRSTESRIVWCCAKGCYAEPVAEHALSLTLTLLRGLNQTPPSTSHHIDTLKRKNITIIGGGSIHQTLLPLLSPFSCLISTITTTSPPFTLETLLPTTDIIIIACPLTPSTHHLFDKSTFERCNPSCILVNVARGEIIHTASLLSALSNGNLKSAALDLIQTEPTQQAHLDELVKQGKLILTPHSAIPAKLISDLLGRRILANLDRLNTGGCDWLGRIDGAKGY